ncbi:MAG TPA: carbohydrate kinase [Gaiellaceae bacterium]|nr:carbohydrate kinase [Gaiellaceae bacterium]
MIVVGGEALVDLVEEGGVLRPVPGGGPFNTAIALGRLGLPVAYLGTLSRDDYGTVLADLLAEAGVAMSLVRFTDAPTPLAVVLKRIDGGNSYTFYLAGTALADLPEHALPALPAEAVALHVGTLALAVDPPAATFQALVEREAGTRAIVFDPNIRPVVFGDPNAYRPRFERLAGLTTVLKMSSDDASWIYPGCEPAEVLERMLTLGPRIVAITLGSEGAIAASAEGRVQLPAVPVVVEDTVGSGDSFGAALIAALYEQDALELGSTRPLDEALLEQAVSYAVTAAAITSTRTGAVPPSRAEIAACWPESSRAD